MISMKRAEKIGENGGRMNSPGRGDLTDGKVKKIIGYEQKSDAKRIKRLM